MLLRTPLLKITSTINSSEKTRRARENGWFRRGRELNFSSQSDEWIFLYFLQAWKKSYLHGANNVPVPRYQDNVVDSEWYFFVSVKSLDHFHDSRRPPQLTHKERNKKYFLKNLTSRLILTASHRLFYYTIDFKSSFFLPRKVRLCVSTREPKKKRFFKSYILFTHQSVIVFTISLSDDSDPFRVFSRNSIFYHS